MPPCQLDTGDSGHNKIIYKVVLQKIKKFTPKIEHQMIKSCNGGRVACGSGEWLVAELLVTNCPELSGIVTNTNNETLISCQLPRYFSLSSAFDQPFVHLSVRGQNWNQAVEVECPSTVLSPDWKIICKSRWIIWFLIRASDTGY